MNFDQLFPDEREKGETPLRQSQLVMLRMLKIFDYLCQKHNIQYFLTAGTLLGAIRHQGFIPWDDDADIGITRENYEKFVKLAVPELPYDIFFQTPETDRYFPSCGLVEAKLKDKYSSYVLSEEFGHRKYHLGLQLDLFVYDRAYLPHNFSLYALNRLLEIMFWKEGDNNKGNIKRAKVLKFIARYSPFPLVYGHSFIKDLKMAKRVGHCFFSPKELSGLTRTKFEDMEASIPIGWHSYLVRVYGNYMQPPPVSGQYGHYGKTPPDPFTPCEHPETLRWNERKAALKSEGGVERTG